MQKAQRGIKSYIFVILNYLRKSVFWLVMHILRLGISYLDLAAAASPRSVHAPDHKIVNGAVTR